MCGTVARGGAPGAEDEIVMSMRHLPSVWDQLFQESDTGYKFADATSRCRGRRHQNALASTWLASLEIEFIPAASGLEMLEVEEQA